MTDKDRFEITTPMNTAEPGPGLSSPGHPMKDKDIVKWRTILSPRSLLFTVVGVFFAVVGLQGFLVPNNYLDGGVTGMSILVKGYAHIHMSILLIVFNFPFVIMGYHKVGRTFAIQALIAMLLLSAGMYFIQIPVFTADNVLIAAFGGFFIGLGIGLVIRGGGVLDGLEIIGQYTQKKSAFSASEIILTLNILMILGAAYKFGIEAGMYSILVYFTAMKTTDYVVDGFEQFTALHVISKDSEKIKAMIVDDFGKALSIYKGERGYLPDSDAVPVDCDVIMVIVTRLEVFRLSEAIMTIDPQAFLYVHSIKEVKGGIVRRN